MTKYIVKFYSELLGRNTQKIFDDYEYARDFCKRYNGIMSIWEE